MHARDGARAPERNDVLDLRQGEAQTASLTDECEQPQHVGRVAAIAGRRPLGWQQNASRLVQPQRLAAHAAACGHLADQQPAVHESKDTACPKGQGQAAGAMLRFALMGPHSRWLTLLLLAGWVILGPIGMAFGSCGAMMALCDGSPCGVVTALGETTPTVPTPVPVADALSISSQHPLTVLRSTLEPPPKPVRLSA